MEAEEVLLEALTIIMSLLHGCCKITLPSLDNHGSPSRVTVTIISHPSQHISGISGDTHIITHKNFQKSENITKNSKYQKRHNLKKNIGFRVDSDILDDSMHHGSNWSISVGSERVAAIKIWGSTFNNVHRNFSFED